MKTRTFPINNNRSSFFRLALAASLLALVLTATGCQIIADWSGSRLLAPGNGAGQTSTDGSTSTETNPDISLDLPCGYLQAVTRITDGIRLDVLFSQDTWRSGDKIKVLIRVTNTTDQPIPWQAGSTSFGPSGSIRAYIVLQGTDIKLTEDGDPRAGDTAMLYGQLEPGASIEKEVIWTTAYTLNGEDILQAWTGKHTLHIAFARGHDDNAGFLAWQQDIQIEADKDSRQSISGDQAIEIARNQPAYDVFRLAHSGEAVAKKEDGQYWVNFSGTWEKVSEELYQETQNKMMAPGASADWKDGVWTIIFIEKLGDPPNSLVIAIDGFTSEVLSIE